MKIALVNHSGNVGKSTLAKHMFLPRMKNAVLIPVESFNVNRFKNVENVGGDEFGDMMEFVNTQENVLVDVGSSNSGDFIRLMKQYRGSHKDFDYYIVPVAPGDKEEEDTISTISKLSAMGVPANKIKVFFNKIPSTVTTKSKLRTLFSTIFADHEEDKRFTIYPDALVQQTEIFQKLKETDNVTADIPVLAADETDYRAKLKETKDEAERHTLVRLISVQGLAQSANENFDEVFKILFKK